MNSLLLGVLSTYCTASSASITYKAAAVQFTVVGEQTATAAANNRASFTAFDQIAADAASAGVQVIVFPEAVLWHWGLHHPGPQPEAARDSIFTGYAEPLPDLGSNPCTAIDEGVGIARALSCIARKHHVILVANPVDIINCTSTNPLCPEDKHFLYNTAVAFDERGVLVAKYHKRHLGGTSPILDEPQGKAEVSSFVSSFGVKFGLFICYDMDFSQPAADLYALGVRDFLFPTFWDNEPPMQTAAATQQGWSRAWGVNLIAANSGDSLSSAGGGLFSSGKVVIALFDPSRANIQESLVGSLTTPPQLQLAGPNPTLSVRLDFSAPDDDNAFSCEVKSINQAVLNQTRASGRCAWAPGGRVAIHAGRVSCQLDAAIRTPISSEPTVSSEPTPGAIRYLLWASDGALTYIGCPDAEKLQTCALLACETAVESNSSTFICSPPSGPSLLMPHIESFVLRANFTAKTEVLPVVNLLPGASSSSGLRSNAAAGALLLPGHRVQFSSVGGNAVLASTKLRADGERIAGAVLYGLRNPD